jgi:hypothetical protein
MEFINKNDLETPRHPSQIRQWVENKINEIDSSKEGKHAVRFRKSLTKELIEEALPLGIFCEKYFGVSELVKVQHVIGNQNYDAIIYDERVEKTTLKYLEITQAHEGQDANSRMQVLEEKGHVNLLGAVDKQGTKHTGFSITVENVAVEHSATFNREVQRIYDAAKRKSEIAYPKNTGLIIIFDDYIAIRDEADSLQLVEFIQNEVLPVLNNFSKVFIVGWSAKTYLEF